MGLSAVADASGVTLHVVARLREHRGLAPRGILSCSQAGGCALSLISRRKGLFAVIVRGADGEEQMLPIPSWNSVPEDRLVHLSIGIGVLGPRLALVRLNVNGRSCVESALAVSVGRLAAWRERLGRAGAGRSATADLDVQEVRRIDMFLGSAWEKRLWRVYAQRWGLSDEAAAAPSPMSPTLGPAARIAADSHLSPAWERA